MASAQMPQAAGTAPPWHTLPPEEAARRMGVDPERGLGAAEVRQRIARHGANEIREQHGPGPWRMLADQFTDFMILVLIAAALVSGLIGDIEDTIAIVVIVILNGVIGFVQEYRADRAVAALRMLAAPNATVRRDGEPSSLSARELVPGDVVLLEAGNVIPADVRLLQCAQLKVDEAALTGESVPIEKSAAAMREPDLALGDRRNMAYKGTVATYGRATALVVGTGMDTELGKIATMLGRAERRPTPLQKRLAHLGRWLAIAALAICAVVFLMGVLRGEPLALMFLTAVSLAVAAIPEALPAVITVSLALGARRMVAKNALIRRLPAVETLGSVTYICSDKTGTLTENKMRVECLYAGGRARATAPESSPPLRLLYTAMALSNDAQPRQSGGAMGDPTELALYEAARAAGYDKRALETDKPRQAEIPFDAERKRMTTLHRDGEEIVSFTKGAPETVLPRCSSVLAENGEPIEPAQLLDEAERMAADGLRVLAIALRRWQETPQDLSPDTVETDLTCLGLVGLMDPPRPEARTAVDLCRTAGIHPLMITGDHPQTARAIAVRLGIIEAGDTVMTGQDLAQLSPESLQQQVEHVRVFARVAPQQKIDIVEALQQRGEYVAMTGDGVNDAPALKRADIGVAMGVAGTDVAREAAHMVLLDDNFATIVAAVREGRHIFDNMRKFIRYAVTCNPAEILTIFLAPFFGLPLPLLPIHILWINLVTDGLPGLALAAEPEEEGIMKRPPRRPQESVFAHGLWQHALWVGSLMAGLTLATQAWAYHSGLAHWRTMTFTVLALSQMAHVMAIRSERESLLHQGLFSNRPLLGAVALTIVLQLATIYVPFAAGIFETSWLSWKELMACLAVSSVIFVAVEMEKWMIRRGWLYRQAPVPRG